jgi:putative ABC transport system permease protein
MLVASFARLQAVDIGLAEPERLLTMRIDVPAHWRHTPGAVQLFQDRTAARMRALPGVTTVALSDSPPVDYLQPQVRDAGVSITVEGGGRFLNGVAEQAPFTPTRRRVTADYFAALGLPLVTGRAFSTGDHAGAARVAVINETMARLHWPGQEALGKRVNFENVRPGRPLPEPWTEIVGIVADARQHRYDAPPRPEIYTPLAQVAMPPPSWTLLVRAAIPPAALAPAIRRGIQEDDPSAAVYDVQTMTSIIDAATATPRYATMLVSLFAALALVLVAVGIHGVAAFTAVQRVREIGIRLALGATRSSIMRLILAQTLRPAAAGMLVGAVTTVLTTRLLGSMLHETSPLDPLLLGIAVAALLVIAIAASVLPARRATRVDPMVALRAE